MTDSIATVSAVEVEDCEFEGELVSKVGLRPVRRVRRLIERGMATVEYAIGLLAAAALAIVILKIITGADFFSVLLKFVVGIIAKIQLP